MKKLEVQTNPAVELVFKNYPVLVRDKILNLRRLIIESAKEIDEIANLSETLKWGEPSYLVKGGSTIRMDWKHSNPEHYAMYFHCKSKLIDTFRELYRDKFVFEGNRAILFHEHDEIPVDELKHCISLALTYHSRKNLPLLGV